MLNTVRSLLLIVPATWVLATSVNAHHAANAFFGGDVVIKEGTLRGAKIVNPHSYLRLTMDDGTDWVFETQQSATVLRQQGFSADMFADGRRVKMSGDSHQDGKKVARWRTFTFLDQSVGVSLDVYIVGRIEDSELIQDIRNAGVSCENGIEQCYRLSSNARAQIEKGHSLEPMLW
jgi:hypothetical protein